MKDRTNPKHTIVHTMLYRFTNMSTLLDLYYYIKMTLKIFSEKRHDTGLSASIHIVVKVVERFLYHHISPALLSAVFRNDPSDTPPILPLLSRILFNESQISLGLSLPDKTPL